MIKLKEPITDFFEIPDLNINTHTQSVFYVYNKWGSIVYLDHNYGLDGDWWDGTTMFPNREVSSFFSQRHWDENPDMITDGTYYYTLEVFNIAHNQKEFYSGDISIFSDDQ